MKLLKHSKVFIKPFVHRPPSSGDPLEDDSLAVPDAGEVTDGVEAAAVSVPSTSHIENSDKQQHCHVSEWSQLLLGSSTKGTTPLNVWVGHVGPSPQTSRVKPILAHHRPPLISRQQHLGLTSFLSWEDDPGPPHIIDRVVPVLIDLVHLITGIGRGLRGELSAVIIIVVVVVWIVGISLSAELVAIVVRYVIDCGESLTHFVQEPVPLPHGPGHHAPREARRQEDDDEDAGPEAAAEAVTARVALPAGRVLLRAVLPLRDGLPQHGGVETLTTLHQVLPGL